MFPSKEKYLAAAVAVMVGLLHFVGLPFLSETNGLAKQFVFVFFTLATALAWLRGGGRIFSPRLLPLLALFVMVLFLSALQGFHRYDALMGTAVVFAGLIFLQFVVHLARSLPSFGTMLVDALLVSGLLASLLGLYQFMHYLCFAGTQRMLIPYLLPASVGIRVSGTYGQSNFFALFLVVCLLAFFYRFIHRPAFFGGMGSGALRFLPPALVAFVFFLTQSRAGILSFSLSFGLLALLFARGKYPGTPGQRREFILLLLSTAVAFLAAKGFLLSGVGEEFGRHGLGYVSNKAGVRFVFWTTAVLVFLDHPWLGVGLDNYKLFLASYQTQAHDLLGFVEFEAMGYTKWAHNEFLQILCEGGLFAFLLLLLFLGLFLRGLWRLAASRGACRDPLFFYCHLFLLPFVIQSCFSFPLRYAPLFVLFLSFLGLLLSGYPCREHSLSRTGRWAIGGALLLALLTAGIIFSQDLKVGTLRSKLGGADSSQSHYDLFAELTENPYSETVALEKGLPYLVHYAAKNEDRNLSGNLIPFAKRLAEVQGAYWQWHNLSLLYNQTGRIKEARQAALVAIDRQPTYEPSWRLLHLLDMLEASRQTGRPLESFYPKNRPILEIPDAGTVPL